MKHSIVFTGGGTTGHVTKNLILIEELQKRHPELKRVYLGIKKGKEAELIRSDLARFIPISSGKLRRYFSLQTVPDFFRFLWGIWQSFWILGRVKPRVVFAAGGYVALPVALAAWLRRIPVIIHETDSYPGLANRIMGRVAAKVLLGFDSASPYFDVKKVEITGNPVSSRLFEGDRKRALKKLGFDDSLPILLVMGGSQGSQAINDLVVNILAELVEHAQVIHLAGKGNTIEFPNERYRCFEYVGPEYVDFLTLADAVVSRGGGNSLAEIAVLGKPALIIPLPLPAAAGDHQRKNALEMAEKRSDWQVFEEDKLTPEELLKALKTLFKAHKKALTGEQEASAVRERLVEQVELYLKDDSKA